MRLQGIYQGQLDKGEPHGKGRFDVDGRSADPKFGPQYMHGDKCLFSGIWRDGSFIGFCADHPGREHDGSSSCRAVRYADEVGDRSRCAGEVAAGRHRDGVDRHRQPAASRARAVQGIVRRERAACAPIAAPRPAVTDVVGGQVHAMFADLPVLMPRSRSSALCARSASARSAAPRCCRMCRRSTNKESRTSTPTTGMRCSRRRKRQRQ